MYKNLMSFSDDGIEYDREVPNDAIISSPGGVSAIHHHYTKGMYSPESTNTMGSYAHNVAVQYPYGNYGGMYHQGKTASMEYDPNPKTEQGFWDNRTPPKVDFIPKADDTTYYTKIEKFDGSSSSTKKISIVSLTIIVLIATIALGLWQESSIKFLNEKVFDDMSPTWIDYLKYAVFATIFLFFVMYLLQIPLQSIEIQS